MAGNAFKLQAGIEMNNVNYKGGAPAKTPPAVVQAYYREVVRIINLQEVSERLMATGHEVIGSTPEQFSEKVKREVEKYRKIILESGMQQE